MKNLVFDNCQTRCWTCFRLRVNIQRHSNIKNSRLAKQQKRIHRKAMHSTICSNSAVGQCAIFLLSYCRRFLFTRWRLKAKAASAGAHLCFLCRTLSNQPLAKWAATSARWVKRTQSAVVFRRERRKSHVGTVGRVEGDGRLHLVLLRRDGLPQPLQPKAISRWFANRSRTCQSSKQGISCRVRRGIISLIGFQAGGRRKISPSNANTLFS